MLSPHLLATKCYLPRNRPDLVYRSRLHRQLDDALRRGQRLILVSAVAGAGKTTLLGDWIARSGVPAAWLSLDDEDNVPFRFWSYVIYALQTVLPGLEQELLATFRAPQPPPLHFLLTDLLNSLAALPGRLLLCMDDYHTISHQEIHEGVAFLLDNLPPQVHIVICTRADPPLPLARIRARGQLAEVRVAELRFTDEEAAVLFKQQAGLNLQERQVEALNVRAEGWAVGLQLAGLSMQGRHDQDQFIESFAGSHHFVLEYLTEEVLNRQPHEIRDFLLKSSALDHLCGPLCDAVTGRGNSEATLRALHQANLFLVPLDDQHRWYRYHHLFADLLANQLRSQYQPEDVRALWLEASRWHEANDAGSEAFKYALKAEEYVLASDIIERDLHEMVSHGELATLMTWIHALPEDLVRARPKLAIIKAWALAFAGAFEAAESLIESAESSVDAGLPGPEASTDRGGIAALRAFIADRRSQATEALQHALLAEELLPPEDLNARSMVPYILGRAHRATGNLDAAERAFHSAIASGRQAGNVLTQVMGWSEVAATHKLRGKLRQAEQIYHEAATLAKAFGKWLVSFDAIINVGLSDLLLERNKLGAAVELANQVIKSLEESEVWGAPTDFILGYVTLADCLRAMGDYEAAAVALGRAGAASSRHPLFPEFNTLLNGCHIRLWLAQGRLDDAVRFIEEKRVAQTGPPVQRESEGITLAQVWLAQGKPDKAVELLSQLVVAAEQGGRYGRLIEILALKGVAHYARREETEAFDSLARSLSLGEPEQYARTYIDLGQPLCALLAACLREDAWGDPRIRRYAQELGSSFAAEPMPPESSDPSITLREAQPLQPLVEPLSSRELEVLGLIALGLSNQEIAETLVVTLHTVKKHSSNIYAKLGVTSRTQAAATARQLGLI